MNEQLLRLGRSLITHTNDTPASVDRAAEALLSALIETPDNLPPKVQRHRTPMICREVARMTKAAVFACQIASYPPQTGGIYSLVLYQPGILAEGQKSKVVCFFVGINMRTCGNASPITPRAIETLIRFTEKGDGR